MALAEAVVGYSLYCDKMDLMAPLVEHIANKHVSVGVTREQYPVVGKILLEALEVHPRSPKVFLEQKSQNLKII